MEDGNNYQETYRATADLKKVADQFDVAIVVVYHSSKQARADFVDDVIGSQRAHGCGGHNHHDEAAQGTAQRSAFDHGTGRRRGRERNPF